MQKQLKLCVQYIEALKRQMNRTIKDRLRNNSEENKTPDFLFISEFVAAPKRSSSVASLAEICSGSLDHLNLKHVSRLETQLHTLYESMSFLANMF